MPKSKTHSGTAKRFKVSGSGKILRQKAGRRHLLEHKSSRVTRRLDGVAVVADVTRRASSACSASDFFPYSTARGVSAPRQIDRILQWHA